MQQQRDTIIPSLQKLAPVKKLTLTVTDTDQESGLQTGQLYELEGVNVQNDGSDIVTIGRQKKGHQQFIGFADKKVSSQQIQVMFASNQFGVRQLSNNRYSSFRIRKDQSYQLLLEQMIVFEEHPKMFLCASQVHPHSQVTTQDSQLISNKIGDFDESTQPVSSFQGQVQDTTKPFLKIMIIEANSPNNEKTFDLQCDGFDDSKEFTVGSDEGCNIQLEGIPAQAGVIGFSSELSAWYVKGVNENSKLNLGFLTYHQILKSLNSCVYRLIDGQDIVVKNTVLKVKLE